VRITEAGKISRGGEKEGRDSISYDHASAGKKGDRTQGIRSIARRCPKQNESKPNRHMKEGCGNRKKRSGNLRSPQGMYSAQVDTLHDQRAQEKPRRQEDAQRKKEKRKCGVGGGADHSNLPRQPSLHGVKRQYHFFSTQISHVNWKRI